MAQHRARRLHGDQSQLVHRRLAQQVPVRRGARARHRERQARPRGARSQLPRHLGVLLAQPRARRRREHDTVLGTPPCGKGEPSQVIRVGHASPACVFRNVEVFGGVRSRPWKRIRRHRDRGPGALSRPASAHRHPTPRNHLVRMNLAARCASRAWSPALPSVRLVAGPAMPSTRPAARRFARRRAGGARRF